MCSYWRSRFGDQLPRGMVVTSCRTERRRWRPSGTRAETPSASQRRCEAAIRPGRHADARPPCDREACRCSAGSAMVGPDEVQEHSAITSAAACASARSRVDTVRRLAGRPPTDGPHLPASAGDACWGTPLDHLTTGPTSAHAVVRYGRPPGPGPGPDGHPAGRATRRTNDRRRRRCGSSTPCGPTPALGPAMFATSCVAISASVIVVAAWRRPLKGLRAELHRVAGSRG